MMKTAWRDVILVDMIFNWRLNVDLAKKYPQNVKSVGFSDPYFLIEKIKEYDKKKRLKIGEG